MKETLPKILVVTINAWRKEGSVHTLMDLFKFWDSDKIAQIYTRADLPNTDVCKRFFQISENAVMKSVFNRSIVTGKRLENSVKDDSAAQKSIEEEHQLYERSRKKHSWLMSICRELVWFLGKWKTKELDEFVNEFDPEVLFIPIYPTVYMGVIQSYVLKKTGKPAVCYLADDNYTYKTCGANPLAYIHRFFLRKVVKKLVDRCDKMFVIVPKQKEEYDRVFGVDSAILTKGIDYSKLTYVEKPLNKPMKMVYTGKLIIGRDKSLVAIAKTLESINRDGVKIELDIYSPDIVADDVMEMLNQHGCSFKGSVPKSEVASIQANSDIVVFVESLDDKFRQAARLSFSTKLTDYFQSGKCIFAIGDSDIAPIHYLRANDAAIIATSYEEIDVRLKQLVELPKLVSEYGKKSFDCGKRNHDVELVKSTLINNICDVHYKNH